MSRSTDDGYTPPSEGSLADRLTWDRHLYPPIKYVTLGLAMLWTLTPLYYALTNSLKTPEQILTSPLGIPWVTFQPAPPSKIAWLQMWQAFPFPEYLLASFVGAFGTAGLATAFGVLAAYAYARLDFPHKESLFVLSIIGFVIPRSLIAVPLFSVVQKAGLLNTYLGLIVAFTSFTLPYSIWLLRGFFEELPENIEESARVDGCTRWGAFYRVILPLSRPAIGSIFMLSFLLAWHNFLIAFILTNDTLHKTLPVGILSLQSQFYVRNIHYIMAGAFLTMVIPMVLYMYLQKQLVSGLGSGAGVKG